MRPPMPSMNLSRRTKIALSVVGILLVLVILFLKFAGVYINYLWFGEVGHRNVYATMFWTRAVLFLVFGVLMAGILALNLVLAYRLRPPFRPMSAEQQNLQHYVVLLEPRRKLILAAVLIIAFLAAGASAQGDWATWQLFLHGGSFGQKDPQFGLDIGFYAWDYPVYRLLLGFGFSAVIFSLLFTIAVNYLTGAIRLQTPGPKTTLSARRHLTILVFVFMLLKAAAYWFDRYAFVFSSRSKFTGASYTDVHIALPAKTFLFWIAIILAIGVLASIWLRSALLPGIGFVVLLILSIIAGGIIPAIVQQVSVKPNASDKEAPFIARNIDATRQAYDIVTKDANHPNGTVVYKNGYGANAQPATTALSATSTTVDNIRILDPNVISPTVSASQKIGRPYAFSSKLDVDRYDLASVLKDYIVAVREQATGSNLSGSQNNWINQHTVYTHGFGFVAAAADTDVTNGDASDYTEGQIPPQGPFNNAQPRVYYGQLMNDYSIVGARDRDREFDGNNDPNVSYTGKGGISLSSLFTRLAFAVNYRETNFVLNDAVSAPGAKVIIVRNPKARLAKVAPFLTVDGDPYPVVDSKTGHIVWMLDAYTTMANYPYSERQSLSAITGTSLRRDQRDTQINYIRNSVKATVDAYDGTVHLYAWDAADPVLKAWRSVFPRLVEPESAMPSELRSHVRYPQDLFNTQRALLAQYHITDPVAAYNGRGTWAVQPDPFLPGNQPAFYVLAAAPGGTSNAPQFQLTTPMVVNQSNNLAAYISADCDYGPNYGQLTVLQVPGNQVVQGPQQVANDLKSTATISKDITQFNQNQSAVVHGNLLTLPVGKSFLYVEPLYVTSTGSGGGSFPTLQRVMVRYNGKIGYATTLQGALDDLRFGRDPGASIAQLGGTTTGPGTSPSSSPSPGSSAPSSGSSAPSSGSSAPSSGAPSSGTSSVPNSTTVQGVIAQLSAARAELSAALASKDYGRIAAAQAKEQTLIDQLLALQSRSSSPSASPSK